MKKTKQYKLELVINGEKKVIKTDNLKESILKLKPDQVFTEMYITITKGEAMFEKKFNLIQARKFFNDDMFLDIFINNLMLG